jgi:HSP20 family protein
MANSLFTPHTFGFTDIFDDFIFNKKDPFRIVLDDIYNTRTTDRKLIRRDKIVSIDNGEQTITINVAAPGVDKGDFEISLTENVLNLSYKNSSDSPNSFFQSSFQRRWSIPKGVTAEDISANYKNGVLAIIVNKPQESIPAVNKIEIN